MKTYQNVYQQSSGWQKPLAVEGFDNAQLVLLFGSTELIKQQAEFDNIKNTFPQATLFGGSTSGEISSTNVHDDTLALTAVCFEKTEVKAHWLPIDSGDKSFDTGIALGQAIDADGLTHVFVLSDGLNVNGSDLVKGLTDSLPENIAITGGLSGDGDRFQETYICFNGEASQKKIGVLAFYGNDLKVGYASLGGWDPFGPHRIVTKAKGNVLYELDGQSVLSLYKEYLGEHASGLPATGLLFPLCLSDNDQSKGVVRTILAVDEENQSMTFAGDIPEGARAQLMKANFDRLIDGAIGAAENSIAKTGGNTELAILISCVGRKLILKQRIEEEVEGVRDVVGEHAALTGFYSYGEISPFAPNAKCELHNQTMTITTLSEK